MAADVELVENALAGDPDAAAELIERNAAAVFAVCLGLLADPDQAQDAAQEALLKGINKLGSLKTPASFRSWLISIAYNVCRDSRRQVRHRQELLDQHLGRTHLEVVNPEQVMVPGLGSATSPVDSGADDDLADALARLPEKFRQPLLLFYFDGLSTLRVAEALGISATGAASRLCRARRALGAILEGSHD